MRLPALFLSCAAAAAQDAAPSLVVRGGRIFEPREERVRPLGQLWIRDGRVLGEREAGVPVPEGVRVIDAAGCTVLPGLFDLHVHTAVAGGVISSNLRVDPEENLATHLFCGVTNVLDLHADEETIFALREKSRGSPGLARLHAAGAAFTSPKGHGTQYGIRAHEVTTREEVSREIESLAAKKPDVVKVILEGGKWGGLPALPSLSEDLVAAVVEAAHAKGLRVMSHVWTADDARMAAEKGADALVHGVFVGKVDEKLAAAMKAGRTAYVPTLGVVIASTRTQSGKSPYANALCEQALHPSLFQSLTDKDQRVAVALSPMGRLGRSQEPVYLANLKTLVDAGVETGIGTDAGNPLVPHGPAVLFEVSLFVDAGMEPARALRAATLSSASILGVEKDFGSLEPGKIADLVVVRGDPTRSIADLWNVEQVVKAGTVVDRDPVRKRNQHRRRPTETRRAGADVPVVIDDFADGDLGSSWGGKWQASADSVAGGKSTCELAVAESNGSRHLRATGSVNEGFQWGTWAGVQIEWDPDRRLLVDATGFKGLKLRLRGTERPCTLTVHRAAVKDYNFFTAAVAVKGEWTEVEVPFEALKQIGFGKSLEWSAADIAGLAIDYRNVPMRKQVHGAFELEVAWVRVY